LFIHEKQAGVSGSDACIGSALLRFLAASKWYTSKQPKRPHLMLFGGGIAIELGDEELGSIGAGGRREQNATVRRIRRSG
jgi:hypothetical protein